VSLWVEDSVVGDVDKIRDLVRWKSIRVSFLRCILIASSRCMSPTPSRKPTHTLTTGNHPDRHLLINYRDKIFNFIQSANKMKIKTETGSFELSHIT
jgi:hypothetical protein